MRRPLSLSLLLGIALCSVGCNPDVESGGAGNSSDGANTTPPLGETGEPITPGNE